MLLQNIPSYSLIIKTPLGSLYAIADDTVLYHAFFVDIANVQQAFGKTIINKPNSLLLTFAHELEAYFAGTLQTFSTPIHLNGTHFQQQVWQRLQEIPYGQTISYSTQATTIGKAAAFRAVALANSQNRLAIIVPCHRVINKDGKLAGYAGGIKRKEWLIAHERKHL